MRPIQKPISSLPHHFGIGVKLTSKNIFLLPLVSGLSCPGFWVWVFLCERADLHAPEAPAYDANAIFGSVLYPSRPAAGGWGSLTGSSMGGEGEGRGACVSLGQSGPVWAERRGGILAHCLSRSLHAILPRHPLTQALTRPTTVSLRQSAYPPLLATLL